MSDEAGTPGVTAIRRPAHDRSGRLIAFCPEAYFEIDSAGRVTEWNPAAERVLGWRRDEILGRPARDTLLAAERGPTTLAAIADDQPPPIGTTRADAAGRELALVHRAGHRVVTRARLFATGGGPDRGIGGFFVDARPVGVARGGRSILEDPLTGLPNRARFASRLAAAVEAARAVPGGVAVVLLDLDRFNAMNDTMGHDAGDLVLALVAERLVRVAGDAELVARFGGDEFLALFVDQGGTAAVKATSFADDARRSLAAPFDVNGTEVFLGASVGIALNTFGVDEAATLLSNAEAAMYAAKRKGGSNSVAFGEAMRFEVLDRMTTEHELHRAIERRELVLHFQPVVEVAGSTTVGMEALVRWRRPGQGLVAPGRFIPVAEESGMIVPIGAWVLEEACHQMRDWHDRRRGPRGSMEVNLSARQIDDPRIIRTLEEILARTGLPPEHLTLEITESALMRDTAAALVVLRGLKELGVALAIDDFGTGFSSLSYLSKFPLDLVKVDRLFVEELGRSNESEEIVSAVISLAHALGLQVVAEGVETAEQLEVLRALGCDLAQGFYFSAPMPASALAASFGRPAIA